MIRTGIIGFGLSGRVFHAPYLSHLKGMRLTTIASSRKAEIEHQYPDTSICTTAELIDNPNLDLVVITSPNDTHFPLAKQALLSGKHVVIEKPMVMDITEGEELIALAKQQNKLLTVYHNCRWNSDYLSIKKLLKDNRIGQPHTWKANFHRYKKTVRAPWKAQRDNGGILYDLGSHLVDQVISLYGWPENIWSDIRIRYPENNAYDYFTLRLYYPRLIVELNSDTRVTQAGPRYEIHGHNGSYLKFGLDSQEQQLSNGMPLDHIDFAVDPTPGNIYYPTITNPEIWPNEKGNHLSFYQQLEQAISSHGQENNTPLPVTAEQGLNVIRLLKLLEQCNGKGITRTLGG